MWQADELPSTLYSGPQAGRPVRPSRSGFVLWYSAVVLWLTWAPFIPASESAGVTFVPPTDPVEILLNVLLLVPIGFVIGLQRAEGGEERSSSRSVLGVALVLCAAISVIAEGGQLFIVNRSPSTWDVLLNSGGGVLAAWLGGEVGRRGVNAETATLLVWTHLYLAALVYLLAMGSFHKGAHRLESWVGDYPVLAGVEVGGLREYEGTVEDAEICTGDRTGRVCAGPGAEASSRARIASTAVREQRVELRATVVSSSSRQSGPARILTFSDGVLQRNATLAQENADLILRLRTPLAGSNGAEVELHLPGAIPEGIPTRVRAIYEEGKVTLRAEHEGAVAERTMSFPLLVWTRIMAWEVNRYDPVQVTLAAVLGVFVLFFPVGLLTVALLTTASPPVRWIAGIAAGAALYTLVTARLAFPFDPLWLLASVAATGAGMLLGWPGFRLELAGRGQ